MWRNMTEYSFLSSTWICSRTDACETHFDEKLIHGAKRGKYKSARAEWRCCFLLDLIVMNWWSTRLDWWFHEIHWLLQIRDNVRCIRRKYQIQKTTARVIIWKRQLEVVRSMRSASYWVKLLPLLMRYPGKSSSWIQWVLEALKSPTMMITSSLYLFLNCSSMSPSWDTILRRELYGGM